MVGLWTVAEFNLILLMMVCRAAPGRVRLPRVCQSPVGTLPAYSDKEAKGGFIYQVICLTSLLKGCDVTYDLKEPIVACPLLANC